MGGVTITELIDKMGLRNMTPELETDNVMLVHADVNRPALQLTGFFDHFDKDRVQIIGYVENAYISTLTPQRRREMFDKLLSSGIPCLVYSRGMAPEEEVLELCNHYGVPCMVSEKTTSDLMAEIIRWLNVKMAPMISIHGVLVDVFGEGVLIMGESGIGKSEAALEHREIRFYQLSMQLQQFLVLCGQHPNQTNFISFHIICSFSLGSLKIIS